MAYQYFSVSLKKQQEKSGLSGKWIPLTILSAIVYGVSAIINACRYCLVTTIIMAIASTVYDELKKQATFVFPATNPGHDTYVQGHVKTLALNDLCGNDFDVLTYTDMLFLIECYNKEQIYNKLL